MTGNLNEVIYDQGRQQLYVSNTDHNEGGSLLADLTNISQR